MNDPPGGVVLYVDDDDSNRRLMSKLFGRHRPADVIVCAASGRAALDEVLARVPELVLLDLTLPDMNGEEVLESIKREHRVPVIVISGHVDEATRRRLLGRGADAYVSKPFDAGELFRLIDHFI